MRGQFSASGGLLAAMMTSAPVFSATVNRLAPAFGLPRTFDGIGKRVVQELVKTFGGTRATGLPISVVAEAASTLVGQGFVVLQNITTPREDGSRIDYVPELWPSEALQYDRSAKTLWALTDQGRVEVVHGDGKWIVISYTATNPWLWGALVPLANTWCDASKGVTDRARSATAHGQAKPIAMLPEHVPIYQSTTDPVTGVVSERLSDEAEALLMLLRDITTSPNGGGIAPFGSSLKYLESLGQNWQVFREILKTTTDDADRILLGQNGSTQQSGGDYIKSRFLFGVRNDLVERDLTVLANGFTEGLLRPWSLANFGKDLDLSIAWLLPDADQAARLDSLSKQYDAYFRALSAAKEVGVVDQAYANQLAEDYDVKPIVIKEADVPDAAPIAA